MIRLLGRFGAVLSIAIRRLWAKRWLSLSSAWGLVVVTVLVLCVPLYADAVYYRVLTQQLGVVRDDGPRLPPYAFVLRYGVYWQTRNPWQDIRHADYFIDQQLPATLHLSRLSLVRQFRSAEMRIWPVSGSAYGSVTAPLMNAPIAAISQFSDHIRLVEGRLPSGFATPTFNEMGQQRQGPPSAVAAAAAISRTIAPIEVLVSQPTAERLGLQLGDRYVAQLGVDDSTALRVPMTIVGVWAPKDASESYWFYKPYEMGSLLITSEQAWVENLAPQLGTHFAEMLWYCSFDGSGVRVWDVPSLISQIKTVTTWGKAPELNISLQASPLEALERYQQDSQTLMMQLYVFSIPLFVLTFAFILLVAGLNADDQRNEIAVLRSRGADIWQVLLLALLQGVLLGAAAFAFGAVASGFIVQMVGQTRSFLQYTGEKSLSVIITPAGLPMGIAAVAIAVLIMVLPVLGAARHTIVDYKHERARSMRPPWWQRMGLDFLLLIPAAYWTLLLQRQGSLDMLGIQGWADSPLGNPSLLLLPTLSMFALTLVFIRCLPLILRLLAWVSSHLPGTSLVLALRQLARSPGQYATPVLLLVSTLALATFTASLATTLDTHLAQQIRYDTGADVRLLGVGQDLKPAATDAWFAPAADSIVASSDAGQANPESTGPRYTFLPVQEYERVSGVEKATRVGDYAMTVHYSMGGTLGGRMMAIDSREFAQVAFWRKDFAAQPLGALMNALSGHPDGVLVPESVLTSNHLQVGDPLPLKVKLPGAQSEIDVNVSIVGTFNLWPTWYPNNTGNGPVFIGNLDNLFEQVGSQLPYDIWLKVGPGVDTKSLVTQLRAVDHSQWKSTEVNTLLVDEQTSPQRQGLFGVLSLGFLASIMLTFVGFFLYAVFTYRRRFIELGVLRAVGFSTTQMVGLLASELAILLVLGVGAGTALGGWASQLYVPFLQGTLADQNRSVPFIVIFDWSRVTMIYGFLAVLFIASLIALVYFLKRLNIFQAIKLGESE
ncbi:MAG TPA: FtsX-like permease family protein [Anaerolineae bacterium]